MKYKQFIYIFSLFVLVSCKSKTEFILQQEQISISEKPVYIDFTDYAEGEIDFNLLLDSSFMGTILLQKDDDIVFKYQVNTERNLYPLNTGIGKWHQVSLKWDISKSTLSVFIDKQLQTTRLIESDRIVSVNTLVFNPGSFNQQGKLEVKDVRCKGNLKRIPKRLKIVTFGDSTTAFRNTITGVYSQRLPELLFKYGIPNIISNQGVGGSHTGFLEDNNRHKVQHARDRLKKAVLDKHPDITIVCFGINDSWFDDGKKMPRISLGAYEKNLRFIIDTIQLSGSEIILMTPNALGNRHEKWRYDNLAKYVNVVRKLSGEKRIPLVDQWKIYEDYSLSGKNIDEYLLDGTHPNDTWHKELAVRLANEIKQMVK